jgi:hypothetical protein
MITFLHYLTSSTNRWQCRIINQHNLFDLSGNPPSPKIELPKCAPYSKHLDAEETEEIRTEEEFDELELSEFTEPTENISFSSSNEAEEEEIGFHAKRPGDSPELLDFTGPPSGINRTAAANINTQSAILNT